MNPRYVKQRDTSSCGPDAIVNILKWLECKVTYDYVKFTRLLCNWEPADPTGEGGGCTNQDLERALKKLSINKKRKIKPSLKEIDAHIDSGGIVLLSYCVPYSRPGFFKEEGHFALCVGRTQRSYWMVNDGHKTTVGRRSRGMMKVITQNDIGGWKCWAWFISK